MTLEIIPNSPSRLIMTIFVFIYLLFQIRSAWCLFKPVFLLKEVYNSQNSLKPAKIAIFSMFSLIIGDTFHFVYLVLAYVKVDLWLNGFSAVSLMLTTIFMTTYYAGLVVFAAKEFKPNNIKESHIILLIIYLIRIVFAVLPGNNYGIEGNTTTIRIVSNVIFSIFGFLTLGMIYFNSKKRATKIDKNYRELVIWGLISFFFYILHLILYPINPMFGMLMLAKSIAYIFELYYLMKGVKSTYFQ